MLDHIDPAVAIPAAIVLWITLGILWDRDRRRAR